MGERELTLGSMAVLRAAPPLSCVDSPLVCCHTLALALAVVLVFVSAVPPHRQTVVAALAGLQHVDAELRHVIVDVDRAGLQCLKDLHSSLVQSVNLVVGH